MAALIIKLTQDRLAREKQILIHVHGGLIEMGLRNGQSKAAFILLRQKKKKPMYL